MTVLSIIVLLGLMLGPPEPPEAAPENWFDFWVGEWDLTWKDGEGNPQHGYNQIVKILDDRVIQESFEARSSPEGQPAFKGKSLSVYNPRTESWHQAWADNQGGYFNFTGKLEGERRMFVTTSTNQEGKELYLRMVFRDIEENSFVWDWEASEDGGESWKLNWQIHYQRRSE